ncbi:GTPase HflX [Auxenochlorella protothecoides]|uniref:GTPase HflX n=1 Tax=Auxenochlorella protothecoides TaxID=3075 RepID=A0A087SIX2_AUXPR|nr:GTPase HflX [Auxenochlorella protothecoides]KFM25676.1 GTPase HflX [Auxenochlorella protothecoides]
MLGATQFAGGSLTLPARYCFVPQPAPRWRCRGPRRTCTTAIRHEDRVSGAGPDVVHVVPQVEPVASPPALPENELPPLSESLSLDTARGRNTPAPVPVAGPDDRERCYLVAVARKSSPRSRAFSAPDSILELGRLAVTAGCQVVGHCIQALEEPHPRTYVGSGKLAELAAAVEGASADTLVFDDELSPGQLRNLDRAFGGAVRLCDRTALILDIFSQRAATREGQLQVALAQAEYQLPRLTRMWTHLERQSGSGQVKGMGEKQIEVDKRLLRGRMARLRSDIEEVRTHRAAYRVRRAEAPIPVIALVGYTNAGKSTLLNTLTHAGVLAEDKLFATLDPTTRRVELGQGQEVLLTDTVGFIQKLPTQLVAAFRATLEEIAEASLLLHVVDVSHPTAAAQVETVNDVLKELGVGGIPVLHVWNKARRHGEGGGPDVDACADPHAVRAVAALRPHSVCVSAMSGEGVEDLLEAVSYMLQQSMVDVEVLVPYSRGEFVDLIHRSGMVQSAEFTATGTRIKAHVPQSLARKLAPMAVGGQGAAPPLQIGLQHRDWEGP